MSVDYCRRCDLPTDECECRPLDGLVSEVYSVLQQLDELADDWGDEAVYRRCRDRLRKALARVESAHDDD